MRDTNVSKTAITGAAFTVYATRPTATLAEIADAAGVGRATLHRHFSGRDDLIRAMSRIALSELEAAVNTAVADAESYTDALRLAIDAMIPLASRQLFLANEPPGRDPDLQEVYERQRAEMTVAIDGARAEGCFARDIPTAWILRVFDTLIYAAWSSVAEGDATPRQAAALVWRTLINGLKEPAI